jgi:hypothetical protein
VRHPRRAPAGTACGDGADACETLTCDGRRHLRGDAHPVQRAAGLAGADAVRRHVRGLPGRRLQHHVRSPARLPVPARRGRVPHRRRGPATRRGLPGRAAQLPRGPAGQRLRRARRRSLVRPRHGRRPRRRNALSPVGRRALRRLPELAARLSDAAPVRLDRLHAGQHRGQHAGPHPGRHRRRGRSGRRALLLELGRSRQSLLPGARRLAAHRCAHRRRPGGEHRPGQHRQPRQRVGRAPQLRLRGCRARARSARRRRGRRLHHRRHDLGLRALFDRYEPRNVGNGNGNMLISQASGYTFLGQALADPTSIARAEAKIAAQLEAICDPRASASTPAAASTCTTRAGRRTC